MLWKCNTAVVYGFGEGKRTWAKKNGVKRTFRQCKTYVQSWGQREYDQYVGPTGSAVWLEPKGTGGQCLGWSWVERGNMALGYWHGGGREGKVGNKEGKKGSLLQEIPGKIRRKWNSVYLKATPSEHFRADSNMTKTESVSPKWYSLPEISSADICLQLLMLYSLSW